MSAFALASWDVPPYPVSPSDRNLSERVLHQPIIANTIFNEVLSDSKDRIPPGPFKTPAAMQSKVEFWLKYYTLYSQQQLLLFDAENLDIVYEVLDVSSLFENYPLAEAQRAARRKKWALIQEYRQAFLKLSKIRKTKLNNLSSVEKKIVSLSKKYNRSVRSLLKGFKWLHGQRDHFYNGLSKINPYLSDIESVFQSSGVSKDVTHLSLIESVFDERATSRLGAKGAWQFMLKPAKEFLIVNKVLDERISPLKSTAAAALLLKRNYRIFKDWTLAITAYNQGLVPLLKCRLRLGKTAEPEEYLSSRSKKCRLGFTGRNYYAQFLAVILASYYRDEFFQLRPVQVPQPSISFQEIETPTSLKEFAISNSLSYWQLERLNPDILKKTMKLPVGYWIAIPGNSGLSPIKLAEQYIQP